MKGRGRKDGSREVGEGEREEDREEIGEMKMEKGERGGKGR